MTSIEIDHVTDDELVALALAADPNAEVLDDAVSVWDLFGNDESALLPGWYMPAPSGRIRTGRRWKRIVAIVMISAFLSIDASGLCSTYGWIEIA